MQCALHERCVVQVRWNAEKGMRGEGGWLLAGKLGDGFGEIMIGKKYFLQRESEWGVC